MVCELRIESFYARLHSTAVGSSSPLLILPSIADADSLCAVRVLTHVLSADSIRFSIHLVSFVASTRALLASFSGTASSSPLCLVLVN
jgi:cell division control protein 45